MNEADPNLSYVDPRVLESMTPEGQDLVGRVLESTDLVITVMDRNSQRLGESSLADESTEPRDIESIKSLPVDEQIAWLLRNFTRRTLLMAGREASRKPRLNDIIGEEAATQLRENHLKRAEIQKRSRLRQTIKSASKPRY